jgi:hypothetical protein
MRLPPLTANCAPKAQSRPTIRKRPDTVDVHDHQLVNALRQETGYNLKGGKVD